MTCMQRWIEAFNGLGIRDMDQVTGLNALKGDYINLTMKMPNGQRAKLLDDAKTYYGTELCKRDGSGRCYGLVADEGQLLVVEYGAGGSDAELVVWTRL